MASPDPVLVAVNERRQQMGKLAFEAYRDEVGGKNVFGDPIPEWDEVGEKVRSGWAAAAEAVEAANLP